MATLRKTLVFLFAMFLAVKVSGQDADIPAPVRKAAKSVGQVLYLSPTGNAYGSCVYLGDKLAATAAHVVDGPGKFETLWQGGEVAIKGRVLYVNVGRDQAIIGLAAEPPVEGVRIATTTHEELMKLKEPLYAVGFDYGVRKRSWGTLASGKSAKLNRDFPVLETLGFAIGGNSGGGLFTKDGELVGNISSTSKDFFYTTSIESLTRGLESIDQNSK
jgi:S1-C subfamily serine protease